VTTALLLGQAMARRFPVGVRASLDAIRTGLSELDDLAEFQAAMIELTESSQAPHNQRRRMERAHYLALAFGSEPLRDDLHPKSVAVFIQAYTRGRIIDDSGAPRRQ
jgi:hypothetical protein